MKAAASWGGSLPDGDAHVIALVIHGRLGIPRSDDLSISPLDAAGITTVRRKRVRDPAWFAPCFPLIAAEFSQDASLVRNATAIAQQDSIVPQPEKVSVDFVSSRDSLRISPCGAIIARDEEVHRGLARRC